MKTEWIQRKNAPHLLLIFHGWGMDRHPIADMKTDDGMDALLAYDYRRLDLAADTLDQLARYRDISVIAWSMGVWAYSQCGALPADRIARAIAINGTPYPIHREYGIDPAVYQATIDHFSEQGRKKFFTRMCGSEMMLTYFQSHQPQRSLSDQKEELLAIQQAALTINRAGVHHFDYALISRRDAIIPTQRQLAWWQGRTPRACLDAPHFPFLLWNCWKEILDYVTEH